MLDVTSETLVLRSVYHTLAYADVFNYPLTADETYRYLPLANVSLVAIMEALSDQTLFSKRSEYYTLRGREEIVQTRLQRGEVASQLWPKARRYGRILAVLPFVRMVAVTGSLAMNNADEGKDIDYMIVTEPGHLWTCRALALLVGRFAKLESVELCPNYLVTTNALELDEHSLYVAHELAQMIPLSGKETYDQMRLLNNWMADYLPNALKAPEIPGDSDLIQKHSVFQKIFEFLFRLPFAHWFETWEMKRKIRRLTHAQSLSAESYFSADVCKGHVDKHKQRTESAVQEKLKQIPLEF